MSKESKKRMEFINNFFNFRIFNVMMIIICQTIPTHEEKCLSNIKNKFFLTKRLSFSCKFLAQNKLIFRE